MQTSNSELLDGSVESTEATTETTLADWRVAERAVAVARRGRIAAKAASEAAEEAAAAALRTAEAAKSALSAMVLAEESARSTAAAARLAARETAADLDDADADASLAEAGELSAHRRYHDAVSRADERVARRDGLG